MVRLPAGEAGTHPAPPLALVAPIALVAGFVAFAIARIALLPGLGFWDTGELQTVGPALGTAHPTGFPAYVILGWLASIVLQPFGEPAFRMNLLSALLVGGAVSLAVVLVVQLTGHAWIALASGLILAAIPIVWNIGTHADAHALHLFLVAVLLVLLVGWERRVRAAGGMFGPGASDAVGPGFRSGRLARPGDRWLLAASITFGVALANHTLTILLAPGIGLFVLATAPSILRRVRFVVGLALAIFLTAFLLYLELPLRAGPFRGPLVYGRPETLDGFLYVVLAQQFVGALYEPFAHLGAKAVDLWNLGWDQVGVLVVLVPIAFIVTAVRQPRYALLTGVSFLVTAWFAASYVNADISRYYLGPALMAVTWLGVFAGGVVDGLDRLMGVEELEVPRGVMLPPRRVGWLGTAGPAAFVLEIAVAIAMLVPTVQALPARADAENLSRQTVAQEWADRAMDVMEPNALVLSWWSYSTTLWYDQIIRGRRPDVTIVDDRTRLDQNLGEVNDVIDANLGKRPVYAVRLAGDDDLAALEERYDVQVIDMPTEQPMLKILGRRTQ